MFVLLRIRQVLIIGYWIVTCRQSRQSNVKVYKKEIRLTRGNKGRKTTAVKKTLVEKHEIVNEINTHLVKKKNRFEIKTKIVDNDKVLVTLLVLS